MIIQQFYQGTRENWSPSLGAQSDTTSATLPPRSLPVALCGPVVSMMTNNVESVRECLPFSHPDSINLSRACCFGHSSAVTVDLPCPLPHTGIPVEPRQSLTGSTRSVPTAITWQSSTRSSSTRGRSLSTQSSLRRCSDLSSSDVSGFLPSLRTGDSVVDPELLGLVENEVELDDDLPPPSSSVVKTHSTELVPVRNVSPFESAFMLAEGRDRGFRGLANTLSYSIVRGAIRTVEWGDQCAKVVLSQAMAQASQHLVSPSLLGRNQRLLPSGRGRRRRYRSVLFSPYPILRCRSAEEYSSTFDTNRRKPYCTRHQSRKPLSPSYIRSLETSVRLFPQVKQFKAKGLDPDCVRPSGFVTTGWNKYTVNPTGDPQLKVLTQWIAAAAATASVTVKNRGPFIGNSNSQTSVGFAGEESPSAWEYHISPVVVCTNNDPRLEQLGAVVRLVYSTDCSAGTLLSLLCDYAAYRRGSTGVQFQSEFSLFDYLLERLHTPTGPSMSS
ncbi:uncharacterized protein DEA37_0003729 [Paragonimus westermani]|uniref:Uncharacterized protein n=1 Tax=Paragonimus westermani TaxID=34504 RepID=A0A5J4NRS1_9TREM|nr:uncharacterized protein DEA37_0003729 [Paragonimus westermani]